MEIADAAPIGSRMSRIAVSGGVVSAAGRFDRQQARDADGRGLGGGDDDFDEGR